jgi:hypothetical protein
MATRFRMIGEAHPARLLGLISLTHSTAGHDALDASRTVEIKATTGRTVYLQPHVPTWSPSCGSTWKTLAGSVVYFGPAAPVWALAGPAPEERALSAVMTGKYGSFLEEHNLPPFEDWWGLGIDVSEAGPDSSWVELYSGAWLSSRRL